MTSYTSARPGRSAEGLRRRRSAAVALLAVLGVLLGVVTAAPAAAAGTPNVEVTITNASGTPIDVVPSTGGFEYDVRASYTCTGDTDCTNMTVSIDAPPVDPYYGTHRKEASGDWVPPFSPAPAGTGRWDLGWTIPLGTVAAGDTGTVIFRYFIKGPAGSPGSQVVNGLGWGNFFPPGFDIDPQVTVTADGAAPLTRTDHAEYQSVVPTPSLGLAVAARTKTDTELPVTVDAWSGCWYRNGYNTFKALYPNLCSESASVAVELPATAEYVAGSGGSYDAGSHTVTVTASPDAWRGLERGAFRVTFPSSAYPTTGTGCTTPETFRASGSATYLNGETKTSSPATLDRATTVDNCQPFARGTFAKSTPATRYQVPTTTPTTGHYWLVDTRNYGNVPAVATVTDATLDQPGLPVHGITTNSSATTTYTLDDGTTGSFTGTTYTAPTGRRVVSATVVSGPLAGPNLTPTGTASTLFRVLFNFTVQPGATPGHRTNTASATLTYPDHPELDPHTPTGSPDTRSVELYTVEPFAKASVDKVSSAASYAIPTTTALTLGHWRVDVCNRANVDGVATVTDDSLDLPGIPVYQVRTSSTATITYELDDGTSQTVTGTTFTAPTGRRIVSATVVSSTLVGPNALPTGAACTLFSVYYDFRVQQGAAPGDRDNTATAVMTYPNTSLGTITATGSPDTHTVSLFTNTPYTINASALTVSNATSPGFPPRAGDEVPWKANGQFCNLATDRTITPQYVFLAPRGWAVLPGGATVTGVPGATATAKTVTYLGVTHDAVVVTWPASLAGTGTTAGSNCVTLGQLTVRTTPTLSAVAGSQTARFFVGDAAGVPAETYSGKVSEATTASDIDDDGTTTDTFASSSASTTLTGVPGMLPVKEICQPDSSQLDGCNWLADPDVTVGVPPSATSVRYRVTVRNTGQTNLTNIVVYDVLPHPGDTGTSDGSATTARGSTVKEVLSGLTVDSSAGMTLAYSTSTNPPRPEVYSGATTGDWTAALSGASAIRATIPSLEAGTSRTFTYEAALVGAGADETACNSIAVSADTMVDSEPSRVCATTQEADFRIEPTDRLPLQAGRVGVVPFVVTNGGGSQSVTGAVTVSVPAEVVLVDLSPEGWECTTHTTTGPVDVTCTPVNLDGTTRSLEKDVPDTIALRVKPTDAAPAELCLEASVKGLMHDPDLDDNTARSCSTTLAAKPELFLSKDDGRPSVAVGEEFTYTITAANGLVGEPVDGVTVTDELPGTLQFVTASPAPTSQSGQTLTWDLGRLDQAAVPGAGGDQGSGGPGSSKSVSVTVRVLPGTQDAVTNAAVATGADPANSGVTLSASGDDTNHVTNVFTDEAAEVTTPHNTPVTTPLEEIASTTGAPLDPSLVTQATAPAHGSLTIDPSTGAVTYVPAAGHSGDDSYRVRVCDTTSPTPQCATATVRVQVGANVVDAVDDAGATRARQPVSTDVRANDTTQSGQALAVPTVTVRPSGGTAESNADGTITYTSAVGFSGTDSYRYQVCDTSSPAPVCDTATVTVEVANVWTPTGVTVQAPHNSSTSTPLADLVTTTGAPVDPASVVRVAAPTHGTLVVDTGDGSLTYTPEPGYAGPDSYRVRVCDTSSPDAQCHEVSVPVTVLPNAVAAPDLAVETHTGQATDPVDVVGGTGSTSGQPLDRPTVTVQPEHGTAVVAADGRITYAPAQGYDGTDSFEYRICDTSHPTPVCDVGLVTVTVAPVADLSVVKTLESPQVVAGEPVTYEVATTNHGPSAGRDVRSIDPVPAAITDPVGAPDPTVDGGTCVTRPTQAADLDLLDPDRGPYSLDSHPTVVECTYPSLPVGTTVRDTVTGTVDGALADGSAVVNQASASAATHDPDLADNRGAAATTSVAVADLVLTVTTGTPTVERGDEVEVTFTVENRGPSDASGVVVDTTTTGLRQLGALLSAPQPAGAAGLAVAAAADGWSIGELVSGDRVVRTVTYQVTGDDARVVGRVLAAAPTDPDPGNNGGAACASGTEGCGVVDFRVLAAPATPDDGAGSGGGDGGGGGALPVTGAPLVSGLVGLALALLAFGAGAILLSRGRRASS